MGMKQGMALLILLIIVWATGTYLIFKYYYTEPDNKSVRIISSHYYPIEYTLEFECKDVDTAYWVERDEIQCRILIDSKNGDMSVIPSILLMVNGIEKRQSINNLNLDNITIKNAIHIEPKNNGFNFKLYPTESGIYDLELSVKLFEPKLVYQVINNKNISIDFEIEPRIENLSAREWYNNYFLKELNVLNKKINFESLSFLYECVDSLATWFTNDLINCNLYVTDLDNKSTHMLTQFKIMEGKKEITLDSETMTSYNHYDDFYKTPSYFSQIEYEQSSIKRQYWFKINKPGNYTAVVSNQMINTNINKINNTDDKVNLRFGILSREEYIQKEENRKIIFISLLIALLFSAPVALNSIKDLFK